MATFRFVPDLSNSITLMIAKFDTNNKKIIGIKFNNHAIYFLSIRRYIAWLLKINLNKHRVYSKETRND